MAQQVRSSWKRVALGGVALAVGLAPISGWAQSQGTGADAITRPGSGTTQRFAKSRWCIGWRYVARSTTSHAVLQPAAIA